MNFYPFHIGDYISHTSHLTDAEDLAYRRLIDLYYQTEKPFEHNLHQLARKVKSTPEIVDILLNEFFEFDENEQLWHNTRADKEIAKYHAMQEGGRLGAEKRWGKGKDKGSDSPPINTPIQTKNQEPRTNNHINIPPDGFNLFWDAYDKKVGKQNAIKEWKKIKPDQELLKVIVNQAKKDKLAKPDNNYRKDPERWLKGGHWQDELIVQHVAEQPKELPLGTDAQIEHAYKVECGGDPTQSRFGSYFEMRKYVQEQRDKRKNGHI